MEEKEPNLVLPPEQDYIYLAFKNKNGKVVSVAKRADSTNKLGFMNIWIDVTGATDTVTITKQEYEDLKAKL